MDEPLTIMEVATGLQVTRATVYRMLADRRLTRTVNGPPRIWRSTVEAYCRMKLLDTEYYEILEAIKVAATQLAYTPLSDDRDLQAALHRLERYEAAQQAQGEAVE